MVENEKNISGISDNLSESITEQAALEKKLSKKSILDGKKVAISISVSEDLESLGLSEQHIKDISIEIARYLIVNGATLLYGGDLRNGGFTKLFSELSYQYKFLSDKKPRFINYFPFPDGRNLSTDEIASLMQKQVEVEILEIPKHLGNQDPKKKYDPFHNNEDKFLIAECLTDMRINMSHDCNARIVIGGIPKNFKGYLPGILEETFYSLKEEKPIYLVGGFGGVTKSLIRVLCGDNPKELTNEFQFDSEFFINFRNFCQGKSTVNFDYNFLVDYFQKHSIESIAKHNGLTTEENYILFESTNIHEIVFLIVKGLQNI
jgi:hypothetical protein